MVGSAGAVRIARVAGALLLMLGVPTGCGNGDDEPAETTVSDSTTLGTTTSTTTTTTSAAPSTTILGRNIFIEITWPQAGAVFTSKEIRVEGRTLPGATVTYGNSRLDAAADGTWITEVLFLSVGCLPLTFHADDDSGDTATDVVTVCYRPSVTTTTSEPSP